MNLVDGQSAPAQHALLTIAREHPETTLCEARKLCAPTHHEVRAEDRPQTLGRDPGCCLRARTPRCRVFAAAREPGTAHFAVARADRGSGARRPQPFLGPGAIFLRARR